MRIELLGMEWVTARASGLNRYVAALHHALAATGAPVTSVVVGPVPDNPCGVRAAGQMAHPLPIRLVRYWSAARGLIDRADVVDAHFALYALLPVRLGRPGGGAIVAHFHGPWAKESALERHLSCLDLFVRRAIERVVYQRAQEVVVLSGAFRRILVESYRVSPWNIHVIPPGVELGKFSAAGREPARSALGVRPDDRVVMSARRLTSRMGLSVLLEAWAMLAPSSGRRMLVVAGDGPLRQDLELQARQLGIADQVQFLGRIDDDTLSSWYRAADLTVVPSVAFEGFGLVVLESLASGTPALVTDSGGLPEAVAGLDPSLVVPAGDAASLAARLDKALDGRVPDRTACRHYAESFSWDRAARANLSVYRRALHSHPTRSLRVVYLDHTARLSGGELALLRLLPSLTGVDAHVILAEDGPLVGKLLRAGVSVEVLPLGDAARTLSRERVRPGALAPASVVMSAGYTARLARRLRQLKPDLVHTNSLKAAIYGGLAARLASVPCIWHLRDRISSDYLPATAANLVQALGRRLPEAVIADSASSLACLSLDRNKGHVVASPVELTLPVPRPDRDGGILRYGILGRIAQWKGQDLFLSAFAAAFSQGKDRAVVVGDAMFEGDRAYAASLPGLAERLGVASRVELRGFTEDVAHELARLDVLVHASVVPEPFGQVIVEGMAAGLAVVAPDAGGPAEIITNGVNGLLYRPGDPEALAHALRRLAADPALRGRLGRAGATRAADFAPSRVGPQVVAIYRQVLGLGPGDELVGR